jgi:hypothetical protein
MDKQVEIMNLMSRKQIVSKGTSDRSIHILKIGDIVMGLVTRHGLDQ